MKNKNIIPWYVLSCPPIVKTSGIGKMSVHGWGMKRLYDSPCSSEHFDCADPAQVFGIHMTFASKTKNEIITIIKQAAGKHRSL